MSNLILTFLKFGTYCIFFILIFWAFTEWVKLMKEPKKNKMTAKEQAKELYYNFIEVGSIGSSYNSKRDAIKCCNITVDVLINFLEKSNCTDLNTIIIIAYWKSVKKELNQID